MCPNIVAVAPRRALTVLALVAAAILPSCKTVHFSEARLFRPRPCGQSGSALSRTAGVFGLRDIVIPLPEDSATLQGLVLEAPNPRGVLLFFGGNEVRHCSASYSGDVAGTSTKRFLDGASSLGLTLVLINYRGYGESGGTLSIANGKADALRLYDALDQDGSFAGLPRIVHGQSIGVVFAAALAAERPVAGVVLESPPTNFQDVIREVTPWYARLLVRVKISPELIAEDTRAQLGRVAAPALVIVGARDRVTPPAMARRVHAATPNAEFRVVPGGSHGDLVRFATYWDTLAAFSQRMLTGRSGE